MSEAALSATSKGQLCTSLARPMCKNLTHSIRAPELESLVEKREDLAPRKGLEATCCFLLLDRPFGHRLQRPSVDRLSVVGPQPEPHQALKFEQPVHRLRALQVLPEDPVPEQSEDVDQHVCLEPEEEHVLPNEVRHPER